TAMVSPLAGGKALPADLVEQIIGKTDGVPLFVEELTKSILESADLKDAGDRWEYAERASTLAIPLTLRDSLMARLDRFTPVKEVAQIGAAIGREFSWELIAAVAPHSEPELDHALAQLVESGLAFQQGAPPDGVYTFKHALVQEAAYDSLLRRRTQELHGKIAWVIEERLPHTQTTEPELLAHQLHRGETVRQGDPAVAEGGQPGARAYGPRRGDRAAEQGPGAGCRAAALGGARRQRAGFAPAVGHHVDGAQRLAGAGGLGQPPPPAGAGECAAAQRCPVADPLGAVPPRVDQGTDCRIAALGHAADERRRDLPRPGSADRRAPLRGNSPFLSRRSDQDPRACRPGVDA